VRDHNYCLHDSVDRAYICVFILYRDMMIPWKEGGRGEGEEGKGYVYIKSTGGPIMSVDVVSMRQHALLLCARSYYTCPYQCTLIHIYKCIPS